VQLFNGTFTHILERGSREALVHKLDLFFPQVRAFSRVVVFRCLGLHWNPV